MDGLFEVGGLLRDRGPSFEPGRMHPGRAADVVLALFFTAKPPPLAALFER
jgi:hypothetical protein